MSVSGCNKGDSETYDKLMARTGTIQEKAPVTVIRLVGEAFICGNEAVIDEGTRVAALLDALRKLALKNLEAKNPGMQLSDTTLTCKDEWDGLKVRSETVRRRGVILSDYVEVTLLIDGSTPRYRKWRSENMKLIKPASGHDPGLKLLEEAMRGRGFEIEGNHRLGQDTWCEVVSYKCWKLKS